MYPPKSAPKYPHGYAYPHLRTTGQDDLLKSKPSIRMGKEDDWRDFERGMVVVPTSFGIYAMKN